MAVIFASRHNIKLKENENFDQCTFAGFEVRFVGNRKKFVFRNFKDFQVIPEIPLSFEQIVEWFVCSS